MIYAFDLEIFKNFFSAVFINVDNEFDRETFIIFKDQDDSDALRRFLKKSDLTLCGYNNLHFDNILLNALDEGADIDRLFALTQDIIREQNQEEIKRLRYKNLGYKSIDFKELLGTDVSLKQITINMEWNKVQDLPIPYDAEVTPEQVALILSYNFNDVLPLVQLWTDLEKEINLRRRVSQLYGVDVLSTSEGHIANVIFEKLYSGRVRQSVKELKKGRTPRTSVILSDCVAKRIKFKSPELKRFYENAKNLNLMNGFNEVLSFGGLRFNLGLGGIHSQDKPGLFVSDGNYQIIDCDVTSFYPNIILQNKLKPEHLTKDFLTILENMTKERTEAKAKGNKVDADILKIAINAVFGKTGNPDYWLYDPLTFFSVTISGQLYLLSLVEILTTNGIEVISANTDGVISKVKKSEIEKYKQLCKQWEETTGFSLELSPYEIYVRRDVNNYIAKGDKVKRKGAFETRKSLSVYHRLVKSYKPDIIPQALEKYFLEGVPITETIRSSRNIFDFLMSQRGDKKFQMILETPKGEIPLQHTNRWYASNNGGILIKKEGQRKLSVTTTPISVLNDIDTKVPFEFYDINFKYYESEAMKIVNQIQPPAIQMNLF